MKLYTVPVAPNPTKVMLYLAERAEAGDALPVEQKIVNTLKGRQREPEHLARNPFGTLPVLELDDGSYLRESLAIIDYLESRYPDGALAPSNAEARARARDLERIIELKIANPLAIYVHYKKSPLGMPPDPVQAAAIEKQIQAPLDFVEETLGDGRELLAGDSVSTADLTLASHLQFVRFIGVDILGERPRLRDWDTRYRARPAAKAILQC